MTKTATKRALTRRHAAEATKAKAMGQLAFTMREFCAVYGIGKDRAYDEVREGRLIARKWGARTIILAEDAERFIAALPRLELPPAASGQGERAA